MDDLKQSIGNFSIPLSPKNYQQKIGPGLHDSAPFFGPTRFSGTNLQKNVHNCLRNPPVLCLFSLSGIILELKMVAFSINWKAKTQV
jgi:hypothetical protein